jgi:hypothetical protein
VRLIPETTVIEGADALASAAGNTGCRNCLCSSGLPGTFAHIEYPGTTTEQERPRSNRRLVSAGAARQGITKAVLCQWSLGVGPSHSSNEAREGVLRRVGGAKGKAEQGTRRRER